MNRYSKLFLTTTLCFLALVARAALPSTEPARIVEVKKAAAAAEQMLFLMAYAAQPICQQDRASWTWSFGPFPRTIPIKRLDKPQRMQAESDVIAAHFKIDPGTHIFLADIDKTPWGYAGLRVREPFEFDLKGEELINLLGLRRNTDPAMVNAEDQKNRSDPFVEVGITRKGEPVKLVVRRVPVCLVSLNVVDSRYRYADSDDSSIIATVPLLERLTRDELVVVLSHEIAHVALKLSKGRGRVKWAAKIFFGTLAEIGENQESGLSEPKEADLVQADRLAMRVAAGFGVEVPSYVEILHKLVADQDSLGAPTYRRTRGITPKREEQLQRSVDLWRLEKKFYSVAGVELQVLREVSRLARQANTNPASAFAVSRELPAEANSELDGTPPASSQSRPSVTTPAPVAPDAISVTK